jgi:predicted flap endonuclease-1-like 5' DNA nuclease
MQDEAGLAGTAAKVSAGLHALPAQGAYTFANVAAQLENIAIEKDQDSAASMLSLNGRARGSVVPQAPLLAKSVSLSGAPAVANLGHLTELQRHC